ncbi:MAG: iron ABC transporter permease [Sphaerochaeta sp.]
MRNRLALALALSTLLLGMISLTLGPAGFSLSDTFLVLTGRSENASQHYIIFQLRLPRVLTAILCGAILGGAGAVFQAVLRNPMADPFILGVSSGASFGVALSITLGYATFLGLPFSALLGALATTALIFLVGSKHKVSQTTLLLTGVAANYILSAGMTLLMFLNHEQYDRILFWTLGSFTSSTWAQVFFMVLCALLFLVPMRLSHSEMDMLLLDEGSALASGLPLQKIRILLLLLATFAVATCVSFFGVIGFIGLMAPHMARLVLGPKHSKMLLGTCLFGSFLLLGSDTLARLLLPTGEMPVGVITSILGAPLFIWMLRKGRYAYV